MKVLHHRCFRQQRPNRTPQHLCCLLLLLICRCSCRRAPMQAAAANCQWQAGSCCARLLQCSAAISSSAAQLPSAAPTAPLHISGAAAVAAAAAELLRRCGHDGQQCGSSADGGGSGTAGRCCVERLAASTPAPQRGQQKQAAAALRSQRQLGRLARLQHRQPPARGPQHCKRLAKSVRRPAGRQEPGFFLMQTPSKSAAQHGTLHHCAPITHPQTTVSRILGPAGSDS